MLTRKIFVLLELCYVWLSGVLHIVWDMSQHYLVFFCAAIAFFFGLLLSKALRLNLDIVLEVFYGGNFLIALLCRSRYRSRVWNL